MALLIDGYNLIHAAGLLGRKLGPGGLERARQTLLQMLRASLPPEELARTTVVFDAEGAPRGLPQTMRFHGIAVYYSTGYDSADDLLAELIQADSAPRSLVVVSSDHQVQQAAQRRRAKPIDSEVWLAETLAKRRKRGQPARSEAKPGMLSAEELAHWLAEFDISTDAIASDPELPEDSPSEPAPEPPAETSKPHATKPDAKSDSPQRPQRRPARQRKQPENDARKPLPGEIDNPFPPDYGDDL